MKPEPGDLIAEKYRIEHALGEGGMGTVFAAVNEATGKQVALKWLLSDLSKDAEYLERFKREARVAGRIDHPNVVTVFDVGSHEESAFIVMELLRGEPLSELLHRGPQEPTELIRMLMPVLRGVHAAHKAGIVHRDLKPDNIFLCRGPHGEAREAKVLDFGISKLDEKLDPARTALTRDGSMVGTPHYMAPEQVRNARNVDIRADVYALGVLFYRALSGQLPFEEDTLQALAVAIAEGNAPQLSEVRPDLEPELAAVVMRAMATDAEARFGSVEAFAVALEPFSDGMLFQKQAAWQDSSGKVALAASRTPASRGSQANPTPTRASSPGPRYAALGAVAAGLLLGAGVWWMMAQKAPAPPAPPELGAAAARSLQPAAPAAAQAPAQQQPLAPPPEAQPARAAAPEPSAPLQPVGDAVMRAEDGQAPRAASQAEDARREEARRKRRERRREERQAKPAATAAVVEPAALPEPAPKPAKPSALEQPTVHNPYLRR